MSGEQPTTALPPVEEHLAIEAAPERLAIEPLPMHSVEAQDAFTQGGEAAYVDYVRTHYSNGKELVVPGNKEVAQRHDGESDEDLNADTAAAIVAFAVGQKGKKHGETDTDGDGKELAVPGNKELDQNGEGVVEKTPAEQLLEVFGGNKDALESTEGQSVVIVALILAREGNPEGALKILQDYADRVKPEAIESQWEEPAKAAIEAEKDKSPLAVAAAKEPLAITAGEGKDKDETPEGPSDEDWDEAHRLNREYGPAAGKYLAALERYTKLSADQRGSHLGRLEATGKLGKFANLMKKVTHPLDTFKSKKVDAERETARKEFLDAVRGLSVFEAGMRGEKIEFGGGEHSRAVLFQLDALDRAEDRILRHQIDATTVRQNNGNGLHGWLREKTGQGGNWLARNWQNSSPVGRVFKVGVPAALIGGGIGGAALLLSPWIAPAVVGAGAAYAGREFGQRYAKVVNRRLAGTAEAQQRLRGAANTRRLEFARDVDTGVDADPNAIDITQPIEAGTKDEYAINNSRYTRAGTVGALAASAAYGGVQALRLLHEGAQQATTTTPSTSKPPTTTPTGPTKPLNPNWYSTQHTGLPAPNQAPPAPALSTNGVPWEVAHRAVQEGMVPKGREMDVVRQAESAWNVLHHTGYHLENIPGNGSEQWIVNAKGAAQSLAQQTRFEQFMADGIRSGQFK